MELFQQASTIMLLGMTLVFIFLAFVVLAVNLAAAIIHRVEGAPRDETDTPSTPPPSFQRQRIAAIAAALHRFKEWN